MKEDILQHMFTLSGSVSQDTFGANPLNRSPSIGAMRSPNYINVAYTNYGNDIIKSVISRIAVDASVVDFRHVKTQQDTGNQESIQSGLIKCLNRRANIDQTGRNFIIDAVWSLLDEEVIAIVPTGYEYDARTIYADDIKSLRIGRVDQWFADSVRIDYYDETKGYHVQELRYKRDVAIIESPLVGILKDSNHTLRMLRDKLRLMNTKDTNAINGKINGFLRFPYSTSSSRRQEQAEKRREQIELEMRDSRYGIPTLDNKEEFIPLSGGIADNIMDDITKLKQDFYNQVGITENIINGVASQAELTLYYSRVVNPILSAIVDGLNMTFISETANTQGQTIKFFRDPFALAPVTDIVTMTDLLSQNASITSNETRGLIGLPPHPSPLADALYNKTIADANQLGGISSAGQGIAPDGSPAAIEEPLTEDELYDNGDGTYTDIEGNIVDIYGNPIEDDDGKEG